jgi:hypothetical protein
MPQLCHDEIAARRGSFGIHPLSHVAAELFECLLGLFGGRLDIRIGKIEVAESSELDLRSHVHRRDEGQVLSVVHLHIVDLWRNQRFQAAFRLGLLPVTRQQTVQHLLLDLVGELLLYQLRWNLALAKTWQSDPPAKLLGDSVGLGGHRRCRHRYCDSSLTRADIFNGNDDTHNSPFSFVKGTDNLRY